MEQEFNPEDLEEIVIEPDQDGRVSVGEIINLLQES